MTLNFKKIMECHLDNKEVFDAIAKSRDHIIPFVGAGLSCPVYPLWRQLLIEIIPSDRDDAVKAVQTYIAKNQYEEAADYLLHSVLGEEKFYRAIKNKFQFKKNDLGKISLATDLLPVVFPKSVITTNYDLLLEELYESRGHKFERIRYHLCEGDTKAISEMAKGDDHHYLFKIHGNWDDDNPYRVFTKESYEAVYGDIRDDAKRTPFVKALIKIFELSTILFLGSSLEQDRILEVLNKANRDQRNCFAILEMPESKKDFQDKELCLSKLRVRPIWYPHGAHKAVAIILKKLSPATDGKNSKKIRHTYGFLGREQEVKEILSAFSGGKSLWVVSGPPGIGKTELCKEILCRVGKKGWKTITLLLQGKQGFSRFSEALKSALSLAEHSDAEIIISTLNGKCRGIHHLLYLDNFEDVLGAADEEQIHDLLGQLRGINNLSILISSRNDMREPNGKSLDPLPLEYAMKLFRSLWRVSDDLSSLRAELADFVDKKLSCLPLAIVLAASHGKDVGGFNQVRQQWENASDNFELEHPDNKKHKSLATALRTSFKFIKNDRICRQIWGLISLIPSAAPEEMLHELIGNSRAEVDKGLIFMRKYSLIERKHNKCFMLTPLKKKIYQFCATNTPGGEEHSLGILSSYYTQKLDKAEDSFPAPCPEHIFISEHLDDIIFLLSFLLRKIKKELLCNIHQKMFNYYQLRTATSAQLLKDIIKHADILELPPKVKANTLQTMGDMQRRLGKTDEAIKCYEEARDIFMSDGANLGLANTLRNMGNLQRRLGDLDKALDLYKQATTIYIDELDNLGWANTLRSMGDLRASQGERDEALGLYNQAEDK